MAVQNWLHFLSQPASTVLGTRKLRFSHHPNIISSFMRLDFQFANAERPHTIAKNLGVALLECYAFRTPDAFCEEFLLFTICCKFNNDATSYELSVCETVYENTTAATAA